MGRPKGSKDSVKRKSKISQPLSRDPSTGRMKTMQLNAGNILLGKKPKFISDETFESPTTSTDEWVPNQEIPPKIEKVEAEVDTTEESKLFLKGAFEIPAGLLNDRRLALIEDELEAIAPSWKKIYDKNIKPAFGEHADLYIFAIGMAGIVGKRIPYINEDLRKLKNGSKSNQLYPSNPSEKGDGQVHTHEAVAPGGQGISESNL